MLTLMSKNIEIYKLNRVYNAFVPGFVIRLSLVCIFEYTFIIFKSICMDV